MRRFSVIVVLVVITLLGLVVLRLPEPNAPQFKRLQTPPSIQYSNEISYDFMSPRPFEGGKIWIRVWSSRTNVEIFLFDIEQRKILGQLIKGWPVTMFDRSTLLCVGPVSRGILLREWLFPLVDRISHGRINLARPSQPHRYWLLDLEKNSAEVMGEFPLFPNFTFQPSPDLRYGYIEAVGADLQVGLYCMDFKRRSMRKLRKLDVYAGGSPQGWWDYKNILFLTTNFDFVLHDVTKEKTSPLIRSDDLAAFLRANMISEQPTNAQVFFVWNGRDNDFYLTDTHQKWLSEESFLIKVERPAGRLKLLSRRFKFEWSDHFD